MGMDPVILCSWLDGGNDPVVVQIGRMTDPRIPEYSSSNLVFTKWSYLSAGESKLGLSQLYVLVCLERPPPTDVRNENQKIHLSTMETSSPREHLAIMLVEKKLFQMVCDAHAPRDAPATTASTKLRSLRTPKQANLAKLGINMFLSHADSIHLRGLPP